MAFVLEEQDEDESLSPRELARRIEERFGTRVHPRSVERALAEEKKTTVNARTAEWSVEQSREVNEDYERIRVFAGGVSLPGRAIVIRRGVPSFLEALRSAGEEKRSVRRSSDPGEQGIVSCDGELVSIVAGMVLEQSRSGRDGERQGEGDGGSPQTAGVPLRAPVVTASGA